MGALVAMAVGLLSGAWAALLGFRLEGAWIASAAVLGVALLLTFSTRASRAQPARRAGVLFAALAALVGQALAPAPPALGEVEPGVLRLEGEVLATRHADAPRAILEVSRGRELDSGTPIPAGTRVSVRGLDVPTGTRVGVITRGQPSQRFYDPTPHPAWPSARRADAHARLVGRPRVLRRAAPWQRAAHALRRALRVRLRRSLSPEAADLARALVLGESGAIEDDARDDVRAAGLSHVLAVSGLHVTLLAGAFVWLAGWLLVRVPRVAARFDVSRLAKALGIPFALAYALVVGDAPSAWRAAVTASIAWALAAGGRRGHPVSVTAAAALLLAVTRPDDLARPGFLLSIVATAALVSMRDTPRSWARAGLVISARTTLATAPFVLWMFGQVPLIGLLANLVVVPIAAGLLLPAAAAHAALTIALPPLAYLSAPVVELAARAFLAATEVFALVPAGQNLPPPDVLEGVLFAAAALALLVVRTWRGRIAVVVLGVLALAGAELRLRSAEQPTDALRVTFLDVGQGDGALVDLPNGQLMVVDAGGAPRGGPDPGAHVLVPLLRARRRTRIDVLVISHPHPDHYGGVGALLDAFEVGEVWDTGQGASERPEGEVAALLAHAREHGARVLGPDALCGRTRRFGAATTRVLWPCPSFDPGWGPNDNSLVVDMRFGGRRLLFTGDVEAHGEGGLLALGASPVDVLKVAHHGSRTSSAAPLIDALRPTVSVASMGRHNRFGHPHPQVWSRLVAHVGCPYRTDRDGGVVVEVSANGALRATPTRSEEGCVAPPATAKRVPATDPPDP